MFNYGEQVKLYKFRGFNANNITALSNRQLWFSQQSDFNDPFEGAYIKDNKLPQELLNAFACKLKNEITEIKFSQMLIDMELKKDELTSEQIFQGIAEYHLQILINIVHKSKIICLSLSNPENDPVNNNLMWSHYADGLRGFCLVFDGDLLQEDIYISSNESMRPIKIQYKSTPNTLSLLDFIKSDFVLDSDQNINFIEAVTKTIATKSVEWSYENELRIMTLDKNNFHNYSEKTLKEIVIGMKTPESQKKILLDIVKANHPEIIIKEARLKPDSYSLETVLL